MRIKILILALSVCFFNKAIAQKGDKSLSAGLLVAVSNDMATYGLTNYNWGTGIGINVTCQSNISERGSLLLQFLVTRFGGTPSYTIAPDMPIVIPISLNGGYRHRLTSSGFYANALVGLEHANKEIYLPLAAGIGKQFLINGSRFIDVGIDLYSGFVRRFNIKAVYSLLQNH